MRRIAVVAFVVAVVAIGCAKGEETTVASPPAATAAATAPASSPKINDHGTKTFTGQSFSVEVEQDNDGDDYYFNPTFIKSPGGATAKVELKNEGSVAHTFTIDALHVDVEVAPDATKDVTVNIGTETRYEFYCRFHKDLGMRGAFQPH